MDTWDLMQNWHLVLPPSRPSADQLVRITSFASDIDRSAPVAVLGSTPEFRDLLHEIGFSEIHVLERNMRFYEAMGTWRVHQNNEHVVQGDWRETLGGLRNTYALILSDLTSGNIPYADRALFYGLVTGALRAGGIFCDKVLTHTGPMLTLDSLFEKYSSLPLNLIHINNFSCEALFCSELLDIENVVDSSRFFTILGERAPGERVASFVKNAALITPLGCKWYYGIRWCDLEADYCPALERNSVGDDYPGSPYFGRQSCSFFERTHRMTGWKKQCAFLCGSLILTVVTTIVTATEDMKFTPANQAIFAVTLFSACLLGNVLLLLHTVAATRQKELEQWAEEQELDDRLTVIRKEYSTLDRKRHGDGDLFVAHYKREISELSSEIHKSSHLDELWVGDRHSQTVARVMSAFLSASS